MKLNSSILAAALGLASVSLASATQYVYYTGSTAARDAIYNALIAGVGFDNANVSFVGAGNSSPGSCTYMCFSNTVSTVPTIVKCLWSGSEAGIADVSGSGLEYFLLDPGTQSVPSFNGTTPVVFGTTGAPSTPNTSYYFQNTVDIAQADNDVAYSKEPTTTAVEVFDNLAIPFVFVKSANSLPDNAAFTNITADNFKVLAQGGDALVQFTGNAADTTPFVYLAGRDDNSGTRVNCLGETGWGIKKAVSQIELVGNTSGANAMVPQSSGYYTDEGQSSGGTLAKSLTDTTTTPDLINGGTGLIAVAYLGLSDAATAENTTYKAVQLTYDGVAYTAANVENGTYAFWGKEYTVKRQGVSSIGAHFAAAIAAGVENYTAGFEIPYSAMNVDRSGPLGYPIY
jgi:hypothetical protein